MFGTDLCAQSEIYWVRCWLGKKKFDALEIESSWVKGGETKASHRHTGPLFIGVNFPFTHPQQLIVLYSRGFQPVAR